MPIISGYSMIPILYYKSLTILLLIKIFILYKVNNTLHYYFGLVLESNIYFYHRAFILDIIVKKTYSKLHPLNSLVIQLLT